MNEATPFNYVCERSFSHYCWLFFSLHDLLSIIAENKSDEMLYI